MYLDMMIRLASAAACLVLLTAGQATAVHARTSWALAQAPAAEALTPEQTRQALAEVARLVRQHFVFVERREAVVSELQRQEASGRYGVTDPKELARRVTEDLKRAGQDRHFGLIHGPAAYAARVAESDPTAAARKTAFLDERARLANHGLEEMRILDGNVRYLRIQQFHWRPDATGQAYEGAMRFLKEGDAVIIDLRANPGGNTSAVRYAISHFMPPDTETLLATFQDEEGRPDQSRVLGYLPAGRVAAPLYVLTSGDTASAAEEFALHVKAFKLGTLVGAATHGAGNNNHLLPVAPGFILSVSFFAPRHAVGDANVEGVGVAPDEAVPPAAALQVAHVRALETLSATGTPARRAAYRWALESARAAANPVNLPGPSSCVTSANTAIGRCGWRATP
jgi:hypothetical protein